MRPGAPNIRKSVSIRSGAGHAGVGRNREMKGETLLKIYAKNGNFIFSREFQYIICEILSTGAQDMQIIKLTNQNLLSEVLI